MVIIIITLMSAIMSIQVVDVPATIRKRVSVMLRMITRGIELVIAKLIQKGGKFFIIKMVNLLGIADSFNLIEYKVLHFLQLSLLL